MLRFLFALARRQWFWLLVWGIVATAVWSVATASAPIDLPPQGPGVLLWRLKIASPLGVALALSGLGLWLPSRWRGLLAWLLAPLRSWAGLDETGEPRPPAST